MKRKGQEEMVGFALIIIIVMIIVLVFVALAANRNKGENSIKSYEVDSFIQAMKQYSTDCSIGNSLNNRNIGQLALDCNEGKRCYDNRYTCDVLENELNGIMEKSWSSSDRGTIKGYSLTLRTNEETILNVTKGNVTRNFKGPVRGLGDELKIDLRIYE